jgi:hypothetical protein
MTSKNNSPKDTETVEAVEAEASVPQQSTSTTDKVTVLKGRGEGGKDAIIISEGEVDNSMKAKFNRLIRNKKVLAGVGAVAGLVVIAIAKSMMAGNYEDDVIITTETDEDGNVTSVTVSNPDTTD